MITAQKIRELRVNIIRNRVQSKPSYFINHVGFADRYFFRINKHFKPKCNPMRWLAVMFAVNIAIAKKLKIQRVDTIFLPKLFVKSFLNCMAEFYTAPAQIPASVFVACVGAPFSHQEFTITVMAEKYYRNPGIIHSPDKMIPHCSIV